MNDLDYVITKNKLEILLLKAQESLKDGTVTQSKLDALNEYRQTKDSYYVSPHSPVERSISLLCDIYPNDADLGAEIRKHFRKK